MAQMSQEMMDLINSVPCCYLATASKDGLPNVVPAGSTAAVSPDTIVIAGVFLRKTLENLGENPKAALVVNSAAPPKTEISIEKLAQVTGGQVKGSVSVLTSGDVHEQTKAMVAQLLGTEAAQMLKATVVLKVEEIYSITPPEAGKRIG